MRRFLASIALGLSFLQAAVIVLFVHSACEPGIWPPGFPLDDAWIHIRFAQNLAASGCFAFNPGEPTAGSTSPLWVVVLAAAGRFTGEFAATALAVCIASSLALALLVYWTVRNLFSGHPWAAVLAALIVILNPRMGWAAVSGMEVCLAALLALLAAAVFAKAEAEKASDARPQVLAGLLFGLASLARPEAHLLFALAVFLKIVRACRRDTRVSALPRITPFAMIAVYLLATLPWHLFSLWSSGSLLPNTFRANYGGIASSYFPVGYYRTYGEWLFIKDHPFVYWFAPIGIAATVYATWQRARGQQPIGAAAADSPARLSFFAQASDGSLAFMQLASLWAVAYPVASRFLLPITRHHMRYMLPLTPFHALLSVAGMMAAGAVVGGLIGRFGRRRTIGRISAIGTGSTRSPLFPLASSAAILLVCATALPRVWHWAHVYARNVSSINRQHVAMARWVSEHTPPDALIAAHDIGALGAIAQRRVYDLFGLVTPEMILTLRQKNPRFRPPPEWYIERLLSRGASYLIGYPQWLRFRAIYPEGFERLHSEMLETEDICGERELVAYRILPDRLKEALARPRREE